MQTQERELLRRIQKGSQNPNLYRRSFDERRKNRCSSPQLQVGTMIWRPPSSDGGSCCSSSSFSSSSSRLPLACQAMQRISLQRKPLPLRKLYRWRSPSYYYSSFAQCHLDPSSAARRRPSLSPPTSDPALGLLHHHRAYNNCNYLVYLLVNSPSATRV